MFHFKVCVFQCSWLFTEKVAILHFVIGSFTENWGRGVKKGGGGGLDRKSWVGRCYPI